MAGLCISSASVKILYEFPHFTNQWRGAPNTQYPDLYICMNIIPRSFAPLISAVKNGGDSGGNLLEEEEYGGSLLDDE